MRDTKIIVGGSLEEDAAAFLDAWHHAERGEDVDETVLAFESWQALASVLTGERSWAGNIGACTPTSQL